MNRRLVMRGLWWKELQQMWPLVVILLGVGALLEAVYSISTAFTGEPMRNGFVMLGLPGLFAVGVGALLVGQEKEQHTIQWLTSLPIAARDIVLTKMLVGIVGLIAVWSATFIMTSLLGTTPPADFIAAPDISPTQGISWWLIHTVAVLFVGFATAWMLRSAFIGLLVLLPLACVPYLLTSIHVWVSDDYSWGQLILVYSSLFAICFVWIGWRAGLRSLGPQAIRVRGANSSAITQQIVYAPARGRASPISVMVWQYVAQNFKVLLGLCLLFIVSAAGLTQTGKTGFGPSSFVFSLGALLSASWLGLLVFQSDAQHKRIQFLADRGVAPWKVWCTRQLIPLSLLTCGSLSLVFLLRSFFTNGWQLLAVAFASYLSAQWIGQLVRSPIVGFVIAPVVAATAIGWGGFAAVQLFAPVWLLALSGSFALLATLTLAAKWMDGRTDWRFWIGHGAFLLLAAVIPLSPFFVFTVRYPRLSRDARIELEAILANTDDRPAFDAVTIMAARKPLESETQDTAQAALRLDAMRELQLKHLKSQLEANPTGMPDFFAVRSLMQDTLLLSMHLEDQDNTSHEKQYREAVFILTEFAKRYRSSGRLVNQDLADSLELLLLELLKQPNANGRLGDSVHSGTLALLRDSPGRDAARRRAIAQSWENSADGQLGGYSLIDYIDRRSILPKQLFVASRNAGVISELLLELLDAPEMERQRIRSELRLLLGRNSEVPDESHLYLTDPTGEKRLLYGEVEYARSLGFLWGRDWEREAAEL